MTFADGWAAINLEMPDRVPRTEYSAESHWALIHAVTGIDVTADSPDEVKQEAQRCMDTGKDCPGFFMAVGNHIPVNTPVENALYYNQVYEELSRR